MATSSVWVLIVGYLVVGTGASVAFLVHRSNGSKGRSNALFMVILWPFLLPAVLLAPSGVRPKSAGRLLRLKDAARSVSVAWDEVSVGSTRERDSVARFVRRLEAKEARLAEIHQAMSRAPEPLQVRLERIADQVAKQIDEGIGVLEDMAAQLTLLRFSGLAEDADTQERDRVEALLIKVDALAQMASGEEGLVYDDQATSARLAS